MEKFYITTTLPYVNADPHIGFALEIIQADVLARYHRQKGDEVIFNTGTDEHGLKIHRKAVERGIETQAYVDEYAAKFHVLKEALNLSYTNFIRTTDASHKKAAQEFWKLCLANDDIYKKQYQVKYCVGCELEKTDSELEGGVCPIHPTYEIELIDEENYFFRFSKYQEPLLKLYQDQPGFVQPDYRLKEIRTFVESGLEDFSISRLKEKMPWGVSVPDDEDHVMYVWFDALVNYISTLGWPTDKENFKSFWPGIQVAGKDNLRQQSAMWQAMLLSAGLPPSKQIFIHGFLTLDGKKISKSIGNTVDPIAVTEKYGADALRYFLLREFPYDGDGDFSFERLEQRYNSELANDLGNLATRSSTIIEKNLRGKVLLNNQAHDDSNIHDHTVKFEFDKALDLIWALIREGNQYIDEQKPWELAKDETQEGKKKLSSVLSHSASHLIRIAGLLQPYLPQTASQLEEAFKADTITKVAPIFPRLDS